MNRFRKALLSTSIVWCSAAVTGCTGQHLTARDPVSPAVELRHTGGLNEDIAISALAQVGAAYRYGGTTPDGFDCSGLIQYVYSQHGVSVPRTSLAQFTAARPIPSDRARAGDVVFFRIGGTVSHVGIYLGANEFLHAPSTGKRVRIDQLDASWYGRHVAGFGRLFD